MALNKEQAEKIKQKLIEQIDSLPIDQKKQLQGIKQQIQEANEEELEQLINSFQSKDTPEECFFCKIIKGEVETIKIFEDKDILAVLDIAPATKGHILVMPKQHIQFIQDLNRDLISKIFEFIRLLSPLLVQILNAKSLSIYIPQGKFAGQNIAHFFIHLIPRYEEDKVIIHWERKEEKREELKKLSEMIKNAAISKIVKQLEEEKKKLLETEKIKKIDEIERIFKQVKRRRV